MKYFNYLLLLIAIAGCASDEKQFGKKEYNKYNSVYYRDGLKDFYYYEDIFTVKPKVTIDTLKLRAELEKILPKDSLFKYYGEGCHNFYFILLDDTKKLQFQFGDEFNLAEDMGWINISFSKENMKFYWGNKLIKTSVVLGEHADTNNIFSNISGEIDGEIKPCVKLFELSIIFDDSGKDIRPWKLTDTKFEKYRAKFTKGYEKKDFKEGMEYPKVERIELEERKKARIAERKFEGEYLKKRPELRRNLTYHLKADLKRGDYWRSFLSFAPVINGGYDELKKHISYPEKAKTNGVEGIVAINVFVTKNGEVVGTQLLESLGFGCEEQVIEAVKKIKFYPLDKKFDYHLTIPYRFALTPDYEKFDLAINKPLLASNSKGNATNVFSVGDEISFTCQIENLSNEKLLYEDLRSELYVNNKIVTFDYYPVEEFKTRQIKMNFTATEKGKFEYVFYVDPNNFLNEENRKNNVVRGYFEVK